MNKAGTKPTAVTTPAAVTKVVRTILVCGVLSVFALTPSAYGQNARLQIDHLNKLEDAATQTVDVTIDSSLLQLAAKFLSSKKINEARAKEIISGLKGIYVKSFKFDKAGEYLEADINAIRSQLKAPGWSRMVNVRSKGVGTSVDVFTMIDEGKVNGLAVIAAEPYQLTVVNIVGPIDLDKLSELEGQFGIPRLDMHHEAVKPQDELKSDATHSELKHQQRP